MLSVITSVYKNEVFEIFKNNITTTIGVPFELISIDNREGLMGLCEVYNKGTVKAQYDILCFAHEDIKIQTPKWGQKVIDAFNQYPDLGLLGVAGSSYKPAMPSGWSFPYAISSTMYINYIQSKTGKPEESVSCYNNPYNEKLSKVICVDGMWFCTTKKIAYEIKFDEATFKRFHCYDVDFSLSVYQKYQVAVTFDILIEHFSSGSFNAEWACETLKLHKKWEKFLPVNLANLDMKAQKTEELGAFYFYLQKFNASTLSVYTLIFLMFSKNLFSLLGFRTITKLNLKVLKDRIVVLVK